MIKQTLQQDQITAMKARDSARSDTLRYILAQIKNKEIESRAELSDEEVILILRKEGKKLQESIASFRSGGRDDLAKESQLQLDILSGYLPAQLTGEELMTRVKTIIESKAELAKSNPSALIGICISELKSVADSAAIASCVRSLTTS